MTLSEFKRAAAKGNMFLELVELFGESGDAIPVNMRGLLRVIETNSVGVSLLKADGKTSKLRFERAALVDYDGVTLTVYGVGERKPSEEEQKMLEAWNKERNGHVEKHLNGCDYLKRREFFLKCGFPYLSGWDTVSGKSYDLKSGKITDPLVRGDVIFKYKVHIK